jgi:hypothetical protein
VTPQSLREELVNRFVHVDHSRNEPFYSGATLNLLEAYSNWSVGSDEALLVEELRKSSTDNVGSNDAEFDMLRGNI